MLGVIRLLFFVKAYLMLRYMFMEHGGKQFESMSLHKMAFETQGLPQLSKYHVPTLLMGTLVFTYPIFQRVKMVEFVC